MSAIYLRKVQGGWLIPDAATDHEAVKRFKDGEVVRADITRPRNLKFFRKFFALLDVAFDVWEEICPRHEHNGQEIRPNRERFRKDVTILAGHGHPVVGLSGDVRIEADSIAFGNMSEEDFEKLYSETINVILTKVLHSSIPRERLDQMVDAVMEFA